MPNPEIVSKSRIDQRVIMCGEFREAADSPEPRQRISAVLVRHGDVLRVSFDRSHPVARIVAKPDPSMEDCDLYVAALPCLQCARLLGVSGIARRVFYVEGYSKRSADALQEHDVEVIRVELER